MATDNPNPNTPASPAGAELDPDRPSPVNTPDNCTVGIDDERFPAYDNGLRWNGFVCPTFRRAVAEQVTAYFNTINAAGPWPEDQDCFVWDGDVIVHIHRAYADDPDYTPTRVEPDADDRYAIGAMEWIWRRTDGHDHPAPRGL